MTDVPADIDLDDMVADAQEWEMVQAGGYTEYQQLERCDNFGEWITVDDHRAEVLRLRQQIWQLMREVAEARLRRDYDK